MGRRLTVRTVWIAIGAQLCCLALVGGLLWQNNSLLAASTESPAVTAWVKDLFSLRTELLSRGELGLLESFYDLKTSGGRWALEKEQARIQYVHQWLQARKIELVQTEVQFTRVEEDKGKERTNISVCVHTLLTYRHRDYADQPETTMGWRTVHWLELNKRGGRWVLAAEWFLDPLENASRWPTVAETRRTLKSGVQQQIGAQNWRQAAVRYADRYSGVKLGPGSGHYNQAYRDFSGLGGDCANFVSQALTDKDGGNLPQDWGWYYDNGEGTVAWLKAASLVQHLTGSGRASCVARGDLAQVCAFTPDHPVGAIRELLPGDIIAYEEKGEIVHVSLVVGFDPAGYLLVNSHSADRHRVPWDLGYSADTVYWLLQVSADNNESKF